MVMGADVSHPSADCRGLKPSIAAIVGSVEPKAANYEVEIRIQDGRQNEEVINDMKNVVKNLLTKFYASNKGRKPEKVIFTMQFTYFPLNHYCFRLSCIAMV